MNTTERLASLDMTWLQLDRETNRLHVTGVLVFDTRLRRDRLEDILRRRLLRLDRFGQHVIRDTVGAIWESGRVDLDYHVRTFALPDAADPRHALQALVGRLASTPLDPGRPLWQLHLVEKYRDGSAVVVRVHQCIADSIALIGVVQSLTDDHPTTPEDAIPPAGQFDASFFEHLYAPLTQAMIEGIKLSGAAWAKYWSLLFYPQQVFDYARTNAALTMEVGKLMGMRDDSRTCLKGTPQGTKLASWSAPLAASSVQAAARTHRATNDATLLACLAGALRRFFVRQGDGAEGVELRALVPVNLRGEKARDPLGNRGGILPLALPVGIDDPVTRLAEIQRRLEDFEDAYRAHDTLGLFNLIGQTPRAVQAQALRLVSAKASALLCHVPAASEARYVDGARISEQMFWSPVTGDMGLSMSILSYAGHYQVGLMVDASMVPDPETITGQLGEELRLLRNAPASSRKPRSRKAASTS